MTSPYVLKLGKHEVIFDSREDVEFFSSLRPRPKREVGIWVDDSYSTPYAMISLFKKNIRIHHLVMGHPLKGFMIDHINRNSLDNRRENLRVCNRSKNSYNRLTKGIQPRWVTKQKNGKYKSYFRISLGTFDTAEEAYRTAFEFANKMHTGLIIPEHEEWNGK